MSDFHKHFLNHIFDAFEDESNSLDIMALGETVRSAKSAGIDTMAYLEQRHDDGLTVSESVAALNAEIAKNSPKSNAASAPVKS
jgi:hypothetical protein